MMHTPDSEADIRAVFAQQAAWCHELGSPLTGLLCELLGKRLDRSTGIGRLILDWPASQPALQFDALPLRLAGGLHALVRRGRLPALAHLYPPQPMPQGDMLWRELASALGEAGDELAPWLARAPQTNEVARAAALMSGLLVVAATTGLPLALYELGASAGLNLMLDRFGYQLGSLSTGVDGSPVRLAPIWEGPAPPATTIAIQDRRGVDLHPVDVTSPADRERLLAYIWADQPERLARTAAAIAIAATNPPMLGQGDAADWLETQLEPAPRSGLVRVVMHSIAFQYFPPATRQRINAIMTRLGVTASAQAPLAWLFYEMDPERPTMAVLRLRLWPGGQEQILATGDSHGTRLSWSASDGSGSSETRS
jgi:hypothetical protein